MIILLLVLTGIEKKHYTKGGNIYKKCTTCEIRGETKGCVGRINADGNIRVISIEEK